jgi:RNA polymerase sigma factor (sigma-70 family)
MASVVSARPKTGTVRFSPDFIANIPTYQKAIRRHRVMRWAREHRLDQDLEQLVLIDLARIDIRFDPNRAASPHHFRMAVLGSRVSDCADTLMRMHSDIDVVDEASLADEQPDDVATVDLDERAYVFENPVLDFAIRKEMATAIHETIKTLPARQHEILKLVLADLTDREIAVQLGVSTQAVNKTRLSGISNLKRGVLARCGVN